VLGSEAETVVTSRFCNIDGRKAVGRFRDTAVLRSGTNEVRAQEIAVEKGGGVLRANGEVVSLLAQKSADGTASSVEAHAEHMVYDSTAREPRIDYTDNVVMKQGDITTQSPASTVFLTADGKGFDRLEVRDKVVIDQGLKHASGRHGVYKPQDKTMTLTGQVRLKDDQGQTVSCQQLVFATGKDAIRCDGREERRTETIFRKEASNP
jgi:lipopolysaccharide transport protein LptA